MVNCMKKQRKKNTKRRKNKKVLKKFLRVVFKNKEISLVLFIIVIAFIALVINNRPVTEINNKGLDFLNTYEYPSYLLTSSDCMSPYDVGDGVITFGPGLTYQTVEEGYNHFNEQLETTYSSENDCIAQKHLFAMQKIRIVSYENVVNKIQEQHNIKFSQDQFNALVLLAYNSPNLFKDEQFINVIISSDGDSAQYIEAADNYYRKLSGYDTKFGQGWYNRIVDSAEMFYYGDYKYQNKLED